MKILAVVGSARKGGNTEVLMDAFIEGAREAGAEVERVRLADLHISPCDGCDTCRVTPNCANDDDMIPLYTKLEESDVWALGTPVYFWGPSAILKAFIDRWYFFTPERQNYRGKKGVLLSPYEDADPGTPRHLVGMLQESFDYLGMEFAGKVLVTANKRGEVANNPKAMAAARELGRKMALPR